MGLSTIGKGDAIDQNLINSLITRINSLEDANNFQAFYNYNNSHVQNSLDDRIITLAWRSTFTVGADTDYYTGWIKTMTYPNGVSFSEPPVITATSCENSGGGGGGAYLVPYITSISGTSFRIGACRVSKVWAAMPTTQTYNFIAVGPTARKF